MTISTVASESHSVVNSYFSGLKHILVKTIFKSQCSQIKRLGNGEGKCCMDTIAHLPRTILLRLFSHSALTTMTPGPRGQLDSVGWPFGLRGQPVSLLNLQLQEQQLSNINIHCISINCQQRQQQQPKKQHQLHLLGFIHFILTCHPGGSLIARDVKVVVIYQATSGMIQRVCKMESKA